MPRRAVTKSVRLTLLTSKILDILATRAALRYILQPRPSFSLPLPTSRLAQLHRPRALYGVVIVSCTTLYTGGADVGGGRGAYISGRYPGTFDITSPRREESGCCFLP
eukprot:scaffold21530_cov37-Tisochrysis_lutea.AAC.4